MAGQVRAACTLFCHSEHPVLQQQRGLIRAIDKIFNTLGVIRGYNVAMVGMGHD
jgi:hypothetical protein